MFFALFIVHLINYINSGLSIGYKLCSWICKYVMLLLDILHYSVSDNIYVVFSKLHSKHYVQPTTESLIQPYHSIGNGV